MSDGFTVVSVDENGTLLLGVNTFEIEKIDSRGKFVILGMDIVDCGKYAPMSGMSSKVTRFIAYNEWITSVDVIYW